MAKTKQRTRQIVVGIIMGSKSDWPTMERCGEGSG